MLQDRNEQERRVKYVEWCDEKNEVDHRHRSVLGEDDSLGFEV